MRHGVIAHSSYNNTGAPSKTEEVRTAERRQSVPWNRDLFDVIEYKFLHENDTSDCIFSEIAKIAI